MMIKPRRRVQTSHDIEVQGLMFRQARILRDMEPEDQRHLFGLIDDAHMKDIARDKLQRVILGQAVFDALVERGDDAPPAASRS